MEQSNASQSERESGPLLCRTVQRYSSRPSIIFDTGSWFVLYRIGGLRLERGRMAMRPLMPIRKESETLSYKKHVATYPKSKKSCLTKPKNSPNKPTRSSIA